MFPWRALVTTLLLTLVPAVHARDLDLDPGRTYTLVGTLSLRYASEGHERQVFLTTENPDALIGQSEQVEVLILGGTYPRTPQSIYREYGPQNRVILTGVGSKGGDLLLSALKPAFVPFIPTPEKVTEIKIEDGVLMITCNIESGYPREFFHVRHELLKADGVREARVWVEDPDPERGRLISRGTPQLRTFELDLVETFGRAPLLIEVRSGRDGSLRKGWRLP